MGQLLTSFYCVLSLVQFSYPFSSLFKNEFFLEDVKVSSASLPLVTPSDSKDRIKIPKLKFPWLQKSCVASRFNFGPGEGSATRRLT